MSVSALLRLLLDLKEWPSLAHALEHWKGDLGKWRQRTNTLLQGFTAHLSPTPPKPLGQVENVRQTNGVPGDYNSYRVHWLFNYHLCLELRGSQTILTLGVKVSNLLRKEKRLYVPTATWLGCVDHVNKITGYFSQDEATICKTNELCLVHILASFIERGE